MIDMTQSLKIKPETKHRRNSMQEMRSRSPSETRNASQIASALKNSMAIEQGEYQESQPKSPFRRNLPTGLKNTAE